MRAGLPGFLGKKLCPNLKIIEPDFERYTTTSRQIRSVLMDYAVSSNNSFQSDSNVPFSSVSLDEVYLDLTSHLKERVQWPVERRSFFPRSNQGSPMLVCR